MSNNIKQKIIQIIKRFKFEELESAVFPVFPELKWNKVKSQLVKNHESFTTVHVIKIMEKFINDTRISNDVLKDRLVKLQVIDMSRHYTKRNWYSYEFKGDNIPNCLLLKEIENKVKQRFKAFKTHVIVKAIEYNGLTFLAIKEEFESSKKVAVPMYFSFVLNEKYIFCSKRILVEKWLKSITYALGYENVKHIKLIGKDICSLIKLLLSRRKAIAENRMICQPLPFQPTLPIITAHGLDFTQHKQRKEYALECFKDNKAILEFLVVQSLQEKWKRKHGLKNLPDENMCISIKYQAPDVIQLLRHLITQGFLIHPLPPYVVNILNLGRNHIVLKNKT